MTIYKQIRIGLAASSLIVLLLAGLISWQSSVGFQQEVTEYSLALCCIEQGDTLSSRWYLQCDPAPYHTDWQLLM